MRICAAYVIIAARLRPLRPPPVLQSGLTSDATTSSIRYRAESNIVCDVRPSRELLRGTLLIDGSVCKGSKAFLANFREGLKLKHFQH